MELFNKVIDEYDRYIVGSLIGKNCDIEYLRKACIDYNATTNKEYKINVSGNDKELLEDIKMKFNKYIKISEDMCNV